MSKDVYRKLAHHLDQLPAGYPAAADGVELRILKRLFSREQAELALHTSLIPEPARVIARRAGIGREQAQERLAEMAQKGLIFSIEKPDQEPLYMAANYAVGIWEYQVENLDKELILDMNQYLPTFVDLETWEKAPQLRTIPVGRSLETTQEIMPYEQAERMVRKQSKIRLAPCICRREHRLAGEGCDKPEESCLVFGMGAYYYERRGIGRDISVEECLEVLARADEAGLVLQPNNAQKLNNICCCCGCCCQVLIYLKKHPNPAKVVSTPFIAAYDPEKCLACGVCVDRCQMDAIALEEDGIILDHKRCIGCGLCVSTCPGEALTMERKPEPEQHYVPRDMMESHIRLGKARGKLGSGKLALMQLRSRWDRFLAK